MSDSQSPEEGDGVLLIPSPRIIEHTNLVDTHQSKQAINRDLLKTGEDHGDGFVVQDEMVLVQRDEHGEIARLTPLSELPGVNYIKSSEELEIFQAKAKPQPSRVKMSMKDRKKLNAILGMRLFKHYSSLPANFPGYSPLRDGLLDTPVDRNPEVLSPEKMGGRLKFATPSEVFRWCVEVVNQRATVIDKKNGITGIQGQALRIE